MQPGTYIICLAAAFVAVTGCHGDDVAAPAPQPVGVRVVQAAPAAAGTEAASVTLPATIEAGQSTSPGFTVGGTIRSIAVQVGDHVAKGQLLATLDDSSLRSAYDMTAASLEEAKDVYRRMEMLHQRKALADIKWVEVQSKLKQAQAACDLARTQMGDTKLYAPFSGTVSQKLADVGQSVLPSAPIVEIISSGALKAAVSVPENMIGSIHVGDPATVTSQAAGGGTFTARVTEKGVSADPVSRAYTVKLSIDSPQGLMDGMVARASFQAPATEQAPQETVLPLGAVMLGDDNVNFVWLDSAGVAARRNVTLGRMTDTGVVIASGISPADRVIVQGQQKVSRGTPLKILK